MFEFDRYDLGSFVQTLQSVQTIYLVWANDEKKCIRSPTCMLMLSFMRDSINTILPKKRKMWLQQVWVWNKYNQLDACWQLDWCDRFCFSKPTLNLHHKQIFIALQSIGQNILLNCYALSFCTFCRLSINNLTIKYDMHKYISRFIISAHKTPLSITLKC